MKKILTLFLFFIFAQNLFAAPLVFKLTKEINHKKDINFETEFVELGTFDAIKYKQIRIGISFKPTTSENVRDFVIYGVEGENEIFLISSDIAKNYVKDLVIDSPPSKIRIKVRGNGIFTLYV